MNIVRYAPSGRFTLIALSVVFSAGLIYGAGVMTAPKTMHGSLVAEQVATQPTDSANWQEALYSIQAQNASSSLGSPNPTSVNQMLQAAQSSNVTDTVGKTILINLSNAKSQGLGDDIPTQEQIISAAAAQVAATKAPKYTTNDLTVVDDSNTTLHSYGNGVMQILIAHPAANQSDTLLAVGNATDHNDPTQLEKLKVIGREYQAVATDLLALPVPKTLSPLHLSVVNAFSATAVSIVDIQTALGDPLRGIVGIQTYQNKIQEIGRVFTNIAQNLNKDGILFNKSEPGSIWQSFISAP
jgi:hypothetical protein